MDDSKPFATDALRQWFDDSRELFDACGLSAVFVRNLGGSASVRLDGERLIADATAWDHASCLDVQFIMVSTGDSQYLHHGECLSPAAFDSELEKFARTLRLIGEGRG